MSASAIQTRRWYGPAFVVGTVSLVLGSVLVVSSEAFGARGDLLSLAVAADLVLVLPGLYYLLLVRGVGLPGLTTLPVALIGLLLASVVIPGDYGIAGVLGLLALPLEALLVAVLVYKARSLARAYRAARGVAPAFEEAFPRAARATLGRFRAVELLVSEVVVLYFALASWRRRPAVPEGGRGFTAHRDSNWSAAFVGLCAVIAIELPIVHLVVSALWSPTIAWILTGLGLYGLLWLVGDYRAMVLRPTLLTRDALHLRIGMRWEADLPLSRIEAIRPYGQEDSERALARLTVGGAPRHVLALSAPVELRGPLGIRRQVTELGIALDGPEFETDLQARLRAHAGVPDVGPRPDARVSEPSSSVVGARPESSPPSYVSGEAAGRAGSSEAEAERRTRAPAWWSAAAAIRWLAAPALERPHAWLVLNAAFLGLLAGTGALLAFHPELARRLAEAVLATGSAAAVLEQLAGAASPAAIALLIFANNFVAIAALVAGLSILLPGIGFATGAAFAAMLGVGLAVALHGPLLPLVAVAPVVLLEGQAIVFAWLFVWSSGRRLRAARRAGLTRWTARRAASRGVGRTLAAVAALLLLAAVLEAALLLMY